MAHLEIARPSVQTDEIIASTGRLDGLQYSASRDASSRDSLARFDIPAPRHPIGPLSTASAQPCSSLSNKTEPAELAPALANVNFDFTLFKVEAPIEFKGVGTALSQVRRKEAESGRSHATARQLGALFAGLLPKTPKLFSAYGKRASEILKSTDANPNGQAADGFFADYVGADATTIWAGATSGGPAIAAHLLACLLASIWDPPEATSIWVEIVQMRKKEIVARFEENDVASLADIGAAQQDISRDALADWDASSRAWLRCAEQVMKREQKQVQLIFQDRSAAIQTLGSTYKSVLAVWTKSLLIFESLLGGISQRVDSGDLILALSAWHLYPDILLIMDPEPVKITQSDAFFSGSVLTLGLDVSSEQGSGVIWSLPLAHLRHYGEPVQCEQNMNFRDRLSLEELKFVLLGAFLANEDSVRLTTKESIVFLDHLHKAIQNESHKGSREAIEIMRVCSHGSWLGILFEASRQYLEAAGLELQNANRMVKLGLRQSNNFLGRSSNKMLSFIRGILTHGVSSSEERVTILLHAAAQLPGNPYNYSIRYQQDYSESGDRIYEYATANARNPHGRHSGNYGKSDSPPTHARWVHFQANGRSSSLLDNPHSSRIPKWHAQTSYQEYHKHPIPEIGQQEAQTSIETRVAALAALGELEFDREYHTVENCGLYDPIAGCSYLNGANQWQNLVLGDDTAALYYFSPPQSSITNRSRDDDYGSNMTDIHSCAAQICAKALLNPSKGQNFSDGYLTRVVFKYLQTQSTEAHNEFHASLIAVSTGISLLLDSKNATVDVRILQMGPLISKKCFYALTKNHSSFVLGELGRKKHDSLSLDALKPVKLQLADAFACLCFLESGRLDLHPVELAKIQVVAMCCGDSIYVANKLYTDPSHWEAERSISPKRIIGNIGRSGIAFLVPPKQPMILPATITDFRDMLYREFDGQLPDCFRSTTLHMSFTTAQQPITTTSFGSRDEELYLLETRLQVYEGSKWVADLNLLATHMMYQSCLHDNDQEDEEQLHTFPVNASITCMDNWTEVRNQTETELNIVRATGNWQARLAATTVCSALGYEVIVLSGNGCRHCVTECEQSFQPRLELVKRSNDLSMVRRGGIMVNLLALLTSMDSFLPPINPMRHADSLSIGRTLACLLYALGLTWPHDRLPTEVLQIIVDGAL
ncbi:hypothetical protein FH972_026279 [Carpinus fangiana]|uniref:Uncharacterized protein n=1 Tax=Carpinus fangiana TaxID=176857 RepID=A0A5N6L3H5_9ROSI|nr:hypothetical protein FH972_026279 [Carpinus fangiana]